ncbi:zinc finger protein 507 [Xyrauchen texanus]|uniref:zinc finger protein 507 n=1 Tax=Xyrauchen texanus TaxID=154827 RepID=UPI002241B590|nr:zinc finger protein 507 [Xyrauchen texanus]
MEDGSGVAVLVPHSRGQQDAVFIPDSHLHDGEDQQKQAADSLIQVIEKLSKIVDKRPRRCTVSGKKRPSMNCASVPAPDCRDGTGGSSDCKRPRELRQDHPTSSCTPGHAFEQEPSSIGTRSVTCYQCNMCRFISPTLEMLKEHLLHHDEQQSDLILMCSECQFTSNQQEELVAHVRLHLEEGDHAKSIIEEQRSALARSIQHRMTNNFESEDTTTPKKWYSFEQGRYRCLICKYECRQQRNLKTHAWKHAGLVDCSYPIFEDEADCPDSSSPPLVQAGKEDTIVVLAAVEGKSQIVHGSNSLQLELCASPEMKCHRETVTVKTMETKMPVLNHIFSIKEEPLVEVQVTPEAQMELELETDSQQASSDSLLSSAQKIISSSGNSAGHVNVIVERLPCAEEPVSSKPLLLSPEVAGDKTILASEEPEVESQHHPIYFKQQEEVVIGWNGGDRQQNETPSSGSPSDVNVPPVRRRTYSESLRLHSLAAEALVAMPMRAPELGKTAVKGIDDLSMQNPDTGQRILEIAKTAAPANPKASSAELTGEIGDPATLLNLGLQSSKGSRDVLVEGPSKAGISMSLLTVIERLQERSDQNTSDDDILKELQDNAQSQQSSGVLGGVVGSGDISTTEGLVEYIDGSERPYRCRLCLYSSGNKGYIKQHLRVHRQRQPYQCPICEHIACDSKDLERHMIRHCKTRMYSCKQCDESFHYKSQLRNHERDRHGINYISGTLTHAAESTVTMEESRKMTDEDPVSEQSIFKCDVCDYTSSTYVGVRNHRRIHNSEKPYRCCSCDFATTNMNSLKCHMKRHPQEHQAMQLLEQYRCSLCGYVCSHPPSLKSHMWKHAGDQNYNYEQVNKAINEAISQSSRSPTMSLKSTPETGVERPYIVLSRKDQQLSEVSSATGATGAATSERSSSSREQASRAMAWRGSTGQAGAGMEYCVLLFCCCICGFESTSKEQLMEHMKQHEGDLINIILSKEQQGNQLTETRSSQ